MKWYILETTKKERMVFQAHAMNIIDGWVQFSIVEMSDIEAHDLYIPAVGVDRILEDVTGEAVEDLKKTIAEIKHASDI